MRKYTFASLVQEYGKVDNRQPRAEKKLEGNITPRQLWAIYIATGANKSVKWADFKTGKVSKLSKAEASEIISEAKASK